MTAGLGSFSYRITQDRDGLGRASSSPVGATTSATLTLVTSNPPIAASGLLVAVATLVGRPVATVPPYAVAPPPRTSACRGTRRRARRPCSQGRVLLRVAIGTLLVYRRWRRFWAIYLLAAPLLLVLVVVCFENIAALLPATL